MFTGYITFVDQSFSGVRLASLAIISYKMMKVEYRQQLNKSVRHSRCMANYPDVRLDINGSVPLH